MKALVVGLVCLVLAWAAPVHAYPQYQLSRDQTCTACHVSPAGGGLLNENGYSVAEGKSHLGTAPETMYGKIPTPDWLMLGGDIRGAGGMFKNEPDPYIYAFPMQVELYARMTFGPISVHLTGGLRSLQEESVPDPADNTQRIDETRGLPLWSREHYITYRHKPEENEGLYVRAGRFMPVFGLRFAEHPMYSRRFGGTQLFTETYGLAVEYVDPKFEVHVTGFIEDYATDPVEHANGVAMYAEYRTSETMAFGLEGMFKNFTNGESLFSDTLSTEYTEFRIGVTNKVYIPGPDLLIQTELQFINGLVDKVQRTPGSAVGGAPKGLLGNLVVSRMLGNFLLLDVGIGHYDSNYRISNLDRDCVDLNLHYFTTSHLELVLNGRYELIGFGDGGTAGAYGMLQLHYRL